MEPQGWSGAGAGQTWGGAGAAEERADAAQVPMRPGPSQLTCAQLSKVFRSPRHSVAVEPYGEPADRLPGDAQVEEDAVGDRILCATADHVALEG